MYLVYFLLASCLLLILFTLDSFRLGITPTSTSKKVREELKKHLPKLYKNAQIIDLGSGFGDFCFFLKKQYPKASVYGVEKGSIPFLFSLWTFFLNKKNRPQIHYGNFLEKDLSDYTCVFCYLYPKISDQLCIKLKKELKKGSWVISHTFALRGLTLVKSIRAHDLYHTPIYIYRI